MLNVCIMPELPEVETIVRQLKEKVVGKIIVNAEIMDKRVVDPEIKTILPVKIKSIERRAKSIIFKLDNGRYILAHLRMTGHFYYLNNGDKGQKQYLVARFTFDDGTYLTHNSIRKFGGMKLMSKEELDLTISKLGIEPLDKEFTLERFKQILTKKANSNIKAVLLKS